jgi:hypothetical protein
MISFTADLKCDSSRVTNYNWVDVGRGGDERAHDADRPTRRVAARTRAARAVGRHLRMELV